MISTLIKSHNFFSMQYFVLLDFDTIIKYCVFHRGVATLLWLLIYKMVLIVRVIILPANSVYTKLKISAISAFATNYFEEFCLFFFFFFFAFWGYTHGIWKFPDQGSNRSYSCWPMSQLQQHRISGTSATYTIAHGSTGSLTH